MASTDHPQEKRAISGPILALAIFTLTALALTGLAIVLLSRGDQPRASGDSAQDLSESEAPTRAVTVRLTSDEEAGLIFNLDNAQCVAGYDRRFDALLTEAEPDPVAVELEDADGTLLGSQTIEGAGGTFADGACRWDVYFNPVPVESRYRVTVRSPKGEVVGSGEGATITLDVSNPS